MICHDQNNNTTNKENGVGTKEATIRNQSMHETWPRTEPQELNKKLTVVFTRHQWTSMSIPIPHSPKSQSYPQPCSPDSQLFIECHCFYSEWMNIIWRWIKPRYRISGVPENRGIFSIPYTGHLHCHLNHTTRLDIVTGPGHSSHLQSKRMAWHLNRDILFPYTHRLFHAPSSSPRSISRATQMPISMTWR